jgi:hypothetical protein
MHCRLHHAVDRISGAGFDRSRHCICDSAGTIVRLVNQVPQRFRWETRQHESFGYLTNRTFPNEVLISNTITPLREKRMLGMVVILVKPSQVDFELRTVPSLSQSRLASYKLAKLGKRFLRLSISDGTGTSISDGSRERSDTEL